MLLWFLLAGLTALTAYVIVRPFLGGTVAMSGGGATAIYRAQLAELTRESERGDLSTQQSEEARREIARRLLAADIAERSSVRRWTPGREAGVGLALAGLVPVAALAFYAVLGRPDLPGQGLADRDMNAAMQNAPLDQVAESLFEKLVMDPARPDGWVMLARTYMQLDRYGEAASAYQEAINQSGEKAGADLYSAWGEALVLAAGGRVTPDARAAFETALRKEPKDPPARYYLALAKAQAGDVPGAQADLNALLADTPDNAPQRPLIVAKLAEISGAPSGAAKDNPAVAGMVASLAAKLEAQPDNLEGWLLLMTSYVRLEERDLAVAALAKAREIFKDRPEALKALEDKAKELGIA